MNELIALLPGLGFLPQPLSPPAPPQAGVSADAFSSLFSAAMLRTPAAPAQPEATPAMIPGDVAWPAAPPAADDPVDAVITQLLRSPLEQPTLPAEEPRTITTTADAPVTSPATRSLAALEPVFRAPLQRVLERMTELGYQVEVVETYRSPERQQYLYEQGRSRPGQVVTWTRASRHSEGLATDVRIVDAAAKPQAYRELARVAGEEGLRTLGPADPGHIELPRTEQPQAARAVAGTDAVPADDSTRRILEIARSAGRVAPVAQDVATYAREVVTAAFRAARAPQPVQAPQIRETPQVDVAPQLREVPQVDMAPQLREVPRPSVNAVPLRVEPLRPSKPESMPAAEPAERERPAAATSPATDAVTPASPPQPRAEPQPQPMPQLREPEQARPAQDVGATVPTDTLRQRVERVVALQEAAAAQPAHTVSLRLNDANDNSARVIVALRGNEVNADLRVSDPAAARELSESLPQLRRALEKHGLTAGWSEPAPAVPMNAGAATPRNGSGTMQQQDRREQEYGSRDGTHDQRQSPRRERERRSQGGDER